MLPSLFKELSLGEKKMKRHCWQLVWWHPGRGSRHPLLPQRWEPIAPFPCHLLFYEIRELATPGSPPADQLADLPRILGRGGTSRGAFAQPKPLWHGPASLASSRWKEAGAHEGEHVPLAVVSPARPHSFCLHEIFGMRKLYY